MTRRKSKRSWYDGWFYTLVFDQKNSPLRHRILKIVEPDKSILDIGCGTGGLALKLAETSRRVVGVDISKPMIQTARKRKERGNYEHVDFILTDGAQISQQLEEKFDYAILSFLIHEIEPELRPKIVAELGKLAAKLIVFDYHIPLPESLMGRFIPVIEFFAGRNHYRNFRDFKQKGGIDHYFSDKIWQKVYDYVNRDKIFRIILFAAEPESASNSHIR